MTHLSAADLTSVDHCVVVSTFMYGHHFHGEKGDGDNIGESGFYSTAYWMNLQMSGLCLVADENQSGGGGGGV